MNSSAAANETESPATTPDARPELYGDPSFWGLTVTQFLGAFNDNLFKQLLLLLLVAVPTPAGPRDLQWRGTLAFSLPFILFSGYAGFLSDRYSKRRVIVLSKVAEIVIMGLGALLFAQFVPPDIPGWVLVLLLVVLFLMGAQSAFFGPGKYGILPEMLRDTDLPRANGFILMTTFVAIIFGTASAGALLDWFPHQLWISGSICVVIAVIGTVTSLWVRPVPAGGAEFEWSSIAIPREIRKCFATDRPLLAAVAVSTIFWMSASMVLMAVNSLGIWQLNLDAQRTSIMVAATSVGIAIGSVIAGSLSRDRFNTRVMKIGAWGLVGSLVLLSLPGLDDSWQVGQQRAESFALAVNTVGSMGLAPAPPLLPVPTPQYTHLLGFYGSIAMLIVLGCFTGMFAVPLQVFMQARPPEGLKGRMIGTQNLLNWVGIALSSPLYALTNSIIVWQAWPSSMSFAFIAAMMFVVALVYRPKSVALSER